MQTIDGPTSGTVKSSADSTPHTPGSSSCIMRNDSQIATPMIALIQARAHRNRSICRSISARISTVSRLFASDGPTMRTIFRL